MFHPKYFWCFGDYYNYKWMKIYEVEDYIKHRDLSVCWVGEGGEE